MLLSNKFNIDDFYRKGHTVNYVEKCTADLLLSTLKRQTFAYPDQYADREHPVYQLNTGLFYCDCVTPITIPKDGTVPLMGRKLLTDDYPVFEEFWSKLAQSEYFRFFNENFGGFTQFSKQMHHFKKSEGLGFHTDFKDTSPLINVLYLTDYELTDADGSYIEFARCDISDEGEFIPETLQVLGRVIPRHGTLVTINNTNPGLLHGVPTMKSDKERYSLICQFGYSDRVLYSLHTKGWDVQ